MSLIRDESLEQVIYKHACWSERMDWHQEALDLLWDSVTFHEQAWESRPRELLEAHIKSAINRIETMLIDEYETLARCRGEDPIVQKIINWALDEAEWWKIADEIVLDAADEVRQQLADEREAVTA